MIAGRREEVLEARGRGDRRGGPYRRRRCARRRRRADRRACLERHGRLDVLVNNAGGQYFVPAEAIAAKGWQAVSRLNVGGTERCRGRVRARDAPGWRRHDHQRDALPAPRPGGHDALERGPRRGRGLHARARARWAPDGIAVIALAAGHFDTEAMRKYPEAVWRARLARSRCSVSARERARLARRAAASPLGRALSGSVVTLDGARDNWFGPWPPAALLDEEGVVPTEERRPRADRASGTAIIAPSPCGRSVVVAQKPSKLLGRVRFPSPAL